VKSLVGRSGKLLLLLIFLTLSVSGVKADQDRVATLFKEGYVLYQQHLASKALIKFKEAAKLGHTEAAYYAGNIIRQDYTYITTESEQYYRQAAEGGDIYAMLRLAQGSSVCGTLRECDYDREAWLERAIETALPMAKEGDTEAMMALSSAYAIKGDPSADFEWVERAADNGHAFAQYWMAVMLDEQGRGFYWTQAGRRADVLKWLEASAEQGFPKAMHKLASEYAQDGRMEEAVVWADRMGKTDYFSAIYEYGLVLIDGPDGAEGLIQYPETKPVEGLAMLFALYRETRRSSVQRSIDRRLPDLSPEIVAEAKAKSEELLVDKPILHYLPKFGI
jgi:TPR repeat protein|tara:strand:+ start:4539 stop:5543 length:1005 start_codon:yes stop_codon:yes gene_type:complete